MKNWVNRVRAIGAGMDYFLALGMSDEDALIESVRSDMRRFGKELDMPSRIPLLFPYSSIDKE